MTNIENNGEFQFGINIRRTELARSLVEIG
jgi:hypothetical protein